MNSNEGFLSFLLSMITIIVALLALWAPNKKRLRIRGYVTTSHTLFSKHYLPVDGKHRREVEVICDLTVTNTGNRPVILTIVTLIVFKKGKEIWDSEEPSRIIGYGSSPDIEFEKLELKPAEMYEMTYSTSNMNVTDSLSREDLEAISKGKCFIHVNDTEGKKYRIRFKDFENKAKEVLQIEGLQLKENLPVRSI
ncbi:MAG: hypothetical protein VB025_08105 [Sphaerochaeta sp.]|nr:hypothetical protein [Sphaerochaeta sp.]